MIIGFSNRSHNNSDNRNGAKFSTIQIDGSRCSDVTLSQGAIILTSIGLPVFCDFPNILSDKLGIMLVLNYLTWYKITLAWTVTCIGQCLNATFWKSDT